MGTFLNLMLMKSANASVTTSAAMEGGGLCACIPADHSAILLFHCFPSSSPSLFPMQEHLKIED
jgi:hypothetical protein